MYFIGWGKLQYPGKAYHKLQQVQFVTVSKTACSQKLSSAPGFDRASSESERENKITDNMLCVNGDNNRSGCQGDSGGPFVIVENGVWFLRGVVSWGSPRQVNLYTESTALLFQTI